MMRAPSASRSEDASAFTVACVPTGMNTGVSTAPCAVCSTPRAGVAVAGQHLKGPLTSAAPARG